MPHANAPLTPTGRLRMVERHLHDGIPIAHVAAEFRVSRPTVTTWVARYRTEGPVGLQDRSSRPHTTTSQLDRQLITRIEDLRRTKKWNDQSQLWVYIYARPFHLNLLRVDEWRHHPLNITCSDGSRYCIPPHTPALDFLDRHRMRFRQLDTSNSCIQEPCSCDAYLSPNSIFN